MKLKQRYKVNKKAIIGQKLICPSCGTEFTKDNYQQAFCRTKGKTVCKDKYWNLVTPTKRNNTTRISPASARFMASQQGRDMLNMRNFGVIAPSIIGASGLISGITTEEYIIMDGVAYDEFGEPMYDISPDDDTHPHDFDANC